MRAQVIGVVIVTWSVLGVAPAVADDLSFTYHRVNGGAGDFSSVDSADIDRDGYVDVVAAAADGNGVYWFANDRSPSSGDFTRYTISEGALTQAWCVHAADVNGDGFVDVVAGARSATGSGTDVIWWENNGVPAAWTEHFITASYDGVRTVTTADVDGDGDLDVVVAAIADTTESAVVWFDNLDGVGGMWYPGEVSHSDLGASGFYGVVAADVDRDGDVDLMASALYGDDLIWFVNDGTPQDWAWTYYYVNPVAEQVDGAAQIALADFDLDGDLDVVAMAYDGDDVLWYENQGNTSSWLRHNVITNTVDGPLAVTTADLDRDGDEDVIFASDLTDTVRWLENEGGTFIAMRTIASSFDGARSVRVADIDDDGDPDVIAAAKNGDLVGWWENAAPSQGSIFNEAHATEIWSPNPKAVHPALVDDDGYLDVVVAEFNSSGSTADIVLFATGGRGPAAWLSQVVESGFSYARSVSAADLDRDGDVDIVGAGDNTLAWWEATGSGWTRHDITTTCTQAQSVQVADLDRDGDQDVVAACSGLAAGTAQVKVYENDGTPANGGWTAHSPGPNQHATDVVVADVTRDGRPDLVVADDDSVVLAVHLATDFSFTNKQIVDYLSGDGNQVDVVDVDDDGDLDILVGVHDTGYWLEYRQPASGWSGEWTWAGHITAINSISGLRAADVDRNGGCDVVFTSDLDSAVFVSDQTISIVGAIATGVQFPQSPEVADLDSDGDLDIVAVAGGATNAVLVYWNPRGLFTDGFEYGADGIWSSVVP